jgi:hypothetical protein
VQTLLVGYDLNRPGQDYENLIEGLKRTGVWWHHLDSTWIVRTEETPAELRDRLKPHIDTNDEVLVIDVTGRAAAWMGFCKKAGDWLLKEL